MIKIISSPRGDWIVIKNTATNETLFEGHSIGYYTLSAVLESLGYKVEYREISDEAMEAGQY